MDFAGLEERSSFGWISSVLSPISSRKRVPPAAARITPAKFSEAPVKAPFRWPNSCASQHLARRGVAVEGEEGPGARGE